MTRILVTGGAGFIGGALVDRLAARGGCEITVLDNLSPQVHGEGADFPRRLRERARCLRGDVTARGDWVEALRGQDAVVHLAAETGTGQSAYEAHRYAAVNVLGTALLTDLLRETRADVRRIVLASSRAVYGEGSYACAACGPFAAVSRPLAQLDAGQFEVMCPGCGRPAAPLATPETAAARPVSVYGATKLAQEHLLEAFAASGGAACTALRFQNVYGPGQSLANPYTGILSIFSTLILTGSRIELYEDGRESRDFVYVEDAVAAIVAALDRPALPRFAYNVGAGRATSVSEIADGLVAAYGRPTPIAVSGRFRAGDVRHCIADITRAASDLDFRPAWELAAGLHAFTRWVLANRPAASRYEASAAELAGRGLLRASRGAP